MNFKPTLPNAQPGAIRAESLLSRVDLLKLSNLSEAMSQARANVWSDRLFARLVCDSGLSASYKSFVRAELDKFGISVLERQQSVTSAPAGIDQGAANVRSLYSKRCALAIFPDQPMDAESLSQATSIEFQMTGVPFHTIAKNRIANWTPCMPIEISTIDQMAKKIMAARTITSGRCQVGAAISPTSVYEDVRSMVDCGVDYVCLLVDVFSDLSLDARIELGSIDMHVEQAMKGLRDSGSSAKLQVSLNAWKSEIMFRLFQAGVDAVSIDSYLAHHKPAAATTNSDRFGSVLSYASTSVSPFAWIAPTLRIYFRILLIGMFFVANCPLRDD